jgi:DHA1 family bicyclomycin/chloramphenicol resistance-like MFS transporter
MASMMSLVALSIDAILPGLSAIGESLNHSKNTDLQLIITMIFLGLGFGQLVFGTLSDSFGRKPIVYIGIIVFLIASIICVTATSLETMLVGRILQGIGLSAPRSISTSIIRDKFSGDYMAKIMSFITVMFILVPMLAPILGQTLINHVNWQSIFIVQMVLSLIVIVWFALRQEETLIKDRRVPFSKHLFFNGIKEFLKFKESIVYTLVSGFMQGSFMVFLSSSKHIFQNQYGYVDEFVYIFAGLSFSMGIATFLNGNLVLRFGMKKLSRIAMMVFTISAFTYILLFFNKPNPNLPVLLFFMSIQFACIGFIFGNVKALTMQPIGHIAGIGASFSGFIATLMAVPIAILIGHFIDQTVLPLFIGYAFAGLCALLLIQFLKKGEKKQLV